MISLLDPKYKIVADNSTDNSAGIQSWADDVCASNGTGFIPTVPNYIAFRSPATFQPRAGVGFCTIRIVAEGNLSGFPFAQFNYGGTGSAFVYKGLRNSTISGVGVNLGNTVRDSVAHEIQFDAQHNSAGNNTFEHMFVALNGCKNSIGFRAGQDEAGRSNAPWLTLRQCNFTGTDATAGNIGIQLGGSQVYGVLLEQCSGCFLSQYLLGGAISTVLTTTANPGDTSLTVADATLFPSAGIVSIAGVQVTYGGKTAATLTGVSVPRAFPAGSVVHQYVAGQGVYPGAGLVTVLMGGGGNNLCDFWVMTNGGTLRVIGARFENGRRFFQDVAICPTGFISHLVHEGGYLCQYRQPGNGVYYARGNGTLCIRDVSIYGNATPWTAGNPLIGSCSSLDVSRCDVAGTDPFYTGMYPAALRNLQLTAGGHVTKTINALRNGAC